MQQSNSQILDRLVSLGHLIGYQITKKYETPGLEMCTSEVITLTFPMGAMLTISGISSGSLENISLILEDGHLLKDK